MEIQPGRSVRVRRRQVPEQTAMVVGGPPAHLRAARPRGPTGWPTTWRPRASARATGSGCSWPTAPSTSRSCWPASRSGPCRSTSTTATWPPSSSYLYADAGLVGLVFHRRFAPGGGRRARRPGRAARRPRGGRRVATRRGLGEEYEDALAAGPTSGGVRRPRRPTTSTASTPAAPPGCPRACCGATTTSSSPPWAGATPSPRATTSPPRGAGRAGAASRG